MGFKKSMMIIELMITHVCTDHVTISNAGLKKSRDQKAATFKENIRLIVYKVSWQKNCNYGNNSGT